MARAASPDSTYGVAALASASGELGSSSSARSKSDFGFRGLLREQQSFANPFEEIAIVGELRLNFGESAIALHDKFRGFALHAGVNVSDAEIPGSQIRRRLAPGGDAGIRGCVRLRFGAALNSVIGESGVAAIFRVAPRHVAGEAVAVFRGMRSDGGKFCRVACEADRAIVCDGLQRRAVRFVVWIVAGAAPQLSVAVARAGAQRELLHMADHFERAGGICVVVCGEHIFRALAGDEIAQLFAGIGDARDSEEMTLLADAVACGGRELRGIDDVAGARIGEMFFGGAVAAFAGDRFF